MSLKLNHNYFLEKYTDFIFDFDGIIKESVEVKNKAYLNLFSEYELGLSKIKKHVTSNAGISRYIKIPLYMEYCGIKPNKESITKYLNKFSKVVFESVISSDWVPGFIKFFNILKYSKKNIYVVSATPENEIKNIIKRSDLDIPINNVYGSPESKTSIFKKFINEYNMNKFIFFGDSITDSKAGFNSSIDFVFRSYKENSFKTPNYYTYKFSDFNDFFN